MLCSKRKSFKRIIKFCAICFFTVLCGVAIITALKNFNYQNVTDGINTEITETLTESSTEDTTEVITITATEDQETQSEIYISGYTNNNVNLRAASSIQSKVVKIIPFNEKIEYVKSDSEWQKVKYKDSIGYIHSDYITNKQIEYKDIFTPSNGIKSYMDYRTITLTSSKQYKLQYTYAYTGNYGIRQINGRYCIAVGSHFTKKVGTYLDLYLENGEIIPCILADCKADIHTDKRNIITEHDGSLAEFIIDKNSLKKEIKLHGDVSKACSEWDSPIEKIRIYEKEV